MDTQRERFAAGSNAGEVAESMIERNKRFMPDMEDQIAQSAERKVIVLAGDAVGDAERDAYWAVDDSVLTAMGEPPAETPGQITAVVISLHPESRSGWLASRHLDDHELDEDE